MNLSQSETWKSEVFDEKFLVEVKHWMSSSYENIWNTYIYLYEKFPGFDNLEDRISSSPVHFVGGCTFSNFYYKKESPKPYCIKYGNDYNHIWNYQEIRQSTQDEAQQIFMDAEQLFNNLKEYCEKQRNIEEVKK